MWYILTLVLGVVVGVTLVATFAVAPLAKALGGFAESLGRR